MRFRQCRGVYFMGMYLMNVPLSWASLAGVHLPPSQSLCPLPPPQGLCPLTPLQSLRPLDRCVTESIFGQEPELAAFPSPALSLL
jgi:hypothetical protein